MLLGNESKLRRIWEQNMEVSRTVAQEPSASYRYTGKRVTFYRCLDRESMLIGDIICALPLAKSDCLRTDNQAGLNSNLR